MSRRLWTMLLALLPLALVSPVAAQKMTEQDSHTEEEKILDAMHKAYIDKDAASIAALYTDDGIRVLASNTVRGRASLERWYAALISGGWEEDPIKLDQVETISDNVFVATGSWSGRSKGSVRRGLWAHTVVRDGNTWRIALAMVNYAP